MASDESLKLAKKWLERQHNRGVSPLPSIMEVKHLILRGVAHESEKWIAAVEKVREKKLKPSDDNWALGWRSACYEILREMGALKGEEGK